MWTCGAVFPISVIMFSYIRQEKDSVCERLKTRIVLVARNGAWLLLHCLALWLLGCLVSAVPVLVNALVDKNVWQGE